MGRLKDFFIRDKEVNQLPREFIAEAIEDLLTQMGDVQVLRVTHGNVGPMGGISTQINCVYEGKWVTINVYGAAEG